jgi:hypothetical protein
MNRSESDNPSGDDPLWIRPARRAYDASFGRLRRQIAALHSDLHDLIGGLETSQASFNAELTRGFMELTQRVEQLDKDLRVIAAGRIELDAVTKRLAVIEDQLIEVSEAVPGSPADPRHDSSG